MTLGSGDKPETQPVGLIVVRVWPGGWGANWLDVDLHVTEAVLTEVLAKVKALHEHEHEEMKV